MPRQKTGRSPGRPPIAGMNDRQTAWKESGPIRKWRTDNRVTLAGLASALGVTQFAVQMWENGNNTPSATNMESLEKLIPDFKNQWVRWLSDRPTLIEAT